MTCEIHTLYAAFIRMLDNTNRHVGRPQIDWRARAEEFGIALEMSTL